MKSLICIIYFILFGLSAATAQNSFLPTGYHVQANGSGTPNELRADLDGDGRPDVFRAIEQGEGEDAMLMAVLKGGKAILYSHPLSMCCGSLSQKNGVIDVHSRGMRGFTYYKFRWDAGAKDFRLIGYATESFGNAANDGSGKSSLNLLTGDYEAAFNSWNERSQKLVALPRIKRRVTIGNRIYLKEFGEAEDEWLAMLNAKYLPKELR